MAVGVSAEEENHACVAVAEQEFSDVFEEDPCSRIALPPIHLAVKPGAGITKRMWCQAFRHTPQEWQFLDGEVMMWLKCKAMYRWNGPSPVCSPLFVTGEPESTPRQRSVLGFQHVSELLEDVQFPLEPFEELLRRTCGDSFYSILDLKSMYHQMQLDAESQWVTTTSWRGELMRFGVLMEGLKPAPAHAQSAMVQIFRVGDKTGEERDRCDLLRRVLELYMDDLFVHTATLSQHLEALRAVLTQCRLYNVKLKRAKCKLGVRAVQWLGHVLTNGVYTPPPSYMQKLKQLPKPATVGDMWSWIGGITWVCKHLPRCQLLVVPLREMVKAVYDGKLGKERQKKQQLGWTAEGERAWEDMRDLLDHPEALAVPDVSRQFGVCVGASIFFFGP